MDSSDDDDDDHTGLMRLRRQLKKFAYADPCEIGCVTKNRRPGVSIKVVVVSYLFFHYDFLNILYFLYRKNVKTNAKIAVIFNRRFIISNIRARVEFEAFCIV